MSGYHVPAAGQARITGGFFKHYMDIMAHKALPYQWRVLNGELGKNPTAQNFRIAAGEASGTFSGVPYQDTDLAKWLDAAGCALAVERTAELEQTADQIIATIVKAQDQDGYLDTYYQLVCPGEKWTDPESHELYCFGHMIEAGVSYFEGTGKRALLDVACRLADHVGRVFGPDGERLPGYRGHEIIEMALMRLADATGRAAYREQAAWFVHARREHPDAFYRDSRKEGNPLDYGCWGWGDPERELLSSEHVTGHAVRAMYLYAGMADVARETGDEALRAHCDRLFHDVTDSQMYVTGGIGTTSVLEAYTYPYDLPNDTMYAETCASIGLCFFGQRLLRMRTAGAYADAMERCLYNILPAAVAQDGEHYFYVNPLEVDAEACRRNPLKTHVKPVRQAWYECACCPPNLARLFLSLPRYLYTMQPDRLNVHLYAPGDAALTLCGQEVLVEQQTDYPFDGDVRIRVRCSSPCVGAVALRIPDWCEEFTLSLNGVEQPAAPLENGYLVLTRDWQGETEIRLSLDIRSEWIQANIRVREDGGKAALRRGPMIYCVEETDNGPLLSDLAADTGAPIAECENRDVAGFGPYPALVTSGTRSGSEIKGEQRLYFPLRRRRAPVTLTAVPYCLWGERVPGEMSVWVREG